jgi:hypothetical protein
VLRYVCIECVKHVYCETRTTGVVFPFLDLDAKQMR